MRNGPTTFRPNEPVREMAKHMRERGGRTVLVTTSDGRLVGLLYREDAERLVDEQVGGGDESGIDHRRSYPEEHTSQQPPPEAPPCQGNEYPGSLDPHAAHDQSLAPPAVAQGAGNYLQCPPHRRVDGLDDADAFHAEAEGREEQREHSPTHTVVEVVDQACLRARKQVAVSYRRPQHNVPKSQGVGFGRVGLHFEPDVLAGVPHQEFRD